MIKNHNLNQVLSCTIKMLLNATFKNGARVIFSQRLDKDSQFDVKFLIRRTYTKHTYSVQFSDVDLVETSTNCDPAEFTVYNRFRVFQLMESLLEQSMLDGEAVCTIYDMDGDKISEFDFIWEG